MSESRSSGRQVVLTPPAYQRERDLRMSEHNIMVISDEIGTSTLLRIMLKRLGFQLVEVHSGHGALQQLDNGTPGAATDQLIFIDDLLSDYHFADLAQHIKLAKPEATICVLSSRPPGMSRT